MRARLRAPVAAVYRSSVENSACRAMTRYGVDVCLPPPLPLMPLLRRRLLGRLFDIARHMMSMAAMHAAMR